MQYLLIYAAGGLLYGLIEILWRGWTHWSMVLCGGLCFLMMYLISDLPLCLVSGHAELLEAGAFTLTEDALRQSFHRITRVWNLGGN